MPRFIAAALICILGVSVQSPVRAQSANFGDAMAWYEREAEKGSAKARFLLGLLSERGAGKCKKYTSQRHLNGF